MYNIIYNVDPRRPTIWQQNNPGTNKIDGEPIVAKRSWRYIPASKYYNMYISSGDDASV